MPDKSSVTIDFDHHRMVAEVDPEAAYAELRANCPVSWTESHGGYWTLARYEDINAVFKDWQTFSSEGGPSIPSLSFLVIPTSLDPPLHTAYRRLLNPLLTKDAVAAHLLPRVRHWTGRCLDAVVTRGHCDLIYDLALPVPAAVTLELVGWDDMSELRWIGDSFHNNLAYPPGHPKRIEAEQNLGRLHHRIEAQIEDRRRHPREDNTILQYAAALEIDGERPRQEHVISLVETAIGGGIDTTAALVANTLVYLHHHPEHRQRLIDEPGLWPAATEEFLRRLGPVRNLTRKAVRDVEVAGCPVAAGERLLLGTASANLDEAIFADPREVVLNRTPNRHFAFGAGIHKCVGLHLARAEFQEIMRQVLERIPDYRLLDDELVPYPSQGVNAGWMALPARFGASRLPADTVEADIAVADG